MSNTSPRSRRVKRPSCAATPPLPQTILPGLDMRIREPAYEPVVEAHLRGILIDGVSGKQPAMQARWYLLRGYQVYDADSKIPIVLKAGTYDKKRQQTLDYNLYRVTYPKDYKPRTQEPNLRTHPFSLGRWKDVYQDQIGKVDYVTGQHRAAGDKITMRKWPLHANAHETDITKPLRIETASVESLESAELACRDYLANREHLTHHEMLV